MRAIAGPGWLCQPVLPPGGMTICCMTVSAACGTCMTSPSALSLSLKSTGSANPALAQTVPTAVPGVARTPVANADAAAPAIARDAMYFFTLRGPVFGYELSRLMLICFLLTEAYEGGRSSIVRENVR